MYQNTDNTSQKRGQQKGCQCPLQAAGFFFYGHQRGGAGPVQQGKQHGAECRHGRPAVCGKERVQGGKIFHFHKTSGGKVCHQDNGQYDFVGGNTEDKGNQNHAVQSHKPRKGIEKAGTVREQAGTRNGNIGGKPDNDAGRGGSHHRAS